MEVQEWKYDIVKKAKRQICYRNNMSSSDIQELELVLFDFLDDGILILRKWRKLQDDTELISGMHDSGIVEYLKNRYNANGRELFSDYSSGGIKAKMDKTPESVLKSTCKQVI